jgi:hypothetical protein
MTTYRNIHGRSIRAVATDPTAEVSEGEIWYNTGSDTFKSIVSVEAWASAANMTTARVYAGSTGTQTATIIFGGFTPPAIATTEEYNGSGFSAGGSLNTARRSIGGAGTQTAGLAIAGYSTTNLNKTEEYDGSSWTETGNYPVSAHNVCGIGIQTAALACGQSSSPLTLTNEYGGSSWTSGGALNTGRSHSEGAGTQTAGLTFTGDPGFGSGASATESYDGSSWTTLANVNTARADAGGGGSQTSAIVFGGRSSAPTNTQATENWNGTSWSTSPATIGYSSSNGIGCANQPGSDTANISMGGSAAPASPQVTTSNEYNKSANVITGAAFSSGGAANFARRQLGYTGAGTQNAFMVYGGFSPSGMVNNSEEYGGATWTATPTLNTARGQNAGFGITTAAVACGGATPTIGGYTEEYNGSSWTTGNSMSTSRYEFGATGILTAGLALQGDQGPSTPFGVTCEEYDGTNWSSGGTASTARRTNSGVGTQTATITAGGQIPGPSATANVESYDGTSWSEVNNLNVARGGNAVMGGPAGATSSVITGGNVPTQFSISEQWNGTNMVTGASMANDRSTHGAGGTSALGIVGLGQVGPSPPYGDADTEEYVGETSVVNVKTLTQS